MRAALLAMLGNDLSVIAGLLTLAFILYVSLVQLGARMAGFEGSTKWAAWSVGMTGAGSFYVVTLASFKAVVLPMPAQLALELMILTLAVRVNYANTTTFRSFVVALLSTGVTLAIAAGVAQV